MTERKSFKRRVRARMEKTGERYTAARSHVVAPDEDEQPVEAAAETGAVGRDRPSDEAVQARTGRTWEEWFSVLDGSGARERTHRETVGYLQDEHGVPGWWAQSVTVQYELARGMRAKHQRPDGYEVGASKTIAVPVDRLYAAFVDGDERRRWLEGDVLRLRTAQPGRSARFDWEDGRTRVNVAFTAKGEAKSAASLQHERLADADEADRTKLFWRERLGVLKEMLEGP
jgi:hypothetical protein